MSDWAALDKGRLRESWVGRMKYGVLEYEL